MAQGNENAAQPAATWSKTYTLVRVRGVSRHARAMLRRAAPSSLQALVAAAPGTAFPPPRSLFRFADAHGPPGMCFPRRSANNTPATRTAGSSLTARCVAAACCGV